MKSERVRDHKIVTMIAIPCCDCIVLISGKAEPNSMEKCRKLIVLESKEN